MRSRPPSGRSTAAKELFRVVLPVQGLHLAPRGRRRPDWRRLIAHWRAGDRAVQPLDVQHAGADDPGPGRVDVHGWIVRTHDVVPPIAPHVDGLAAAIARANRR